MGDIPQDIIIDVLSRLQVKSVVRFRCVCKSWRSLISESQFVKAHLNRAITDVSVGCWRLLIPDYSLESIDYEALLQLLSEKKNKAARKNKGGKYACTVLDFPQSRPKRYARFIGYCHGMVGMEVDNEKIVICNPCTRKFRELPKPTSINFKYTIHGGGLGYDSSVDDYKFVIIGLSDVDSDGEFIFNVEVFSLRSNSWRLLHDIPPDIFGICGLGPGVFLNGALHWIAICESGQQIISFDLATEKFLERLSLPPVHSKCRNLILLRGYLSVTDTSSHKTQVWAMKEYGVEASWTKLFTVDIRFNDDVYHYLRPMCFSKNGDLLVNAHNEIRIYNPKKKTSRKFYNGSWWWKEFIVYIESLVSPCGNGENNEHNNKQ